MWGSLWSNSILWRYWLQLQVHGVGRTKTIKTSFYVNCLESLTVIPCDLILGIPGAKQLCLNGVLGDSMSFIRIPHCCICWSLQIIFAVVFVDFVLLDLVTHFYLISLSLFFALGVVCRSRINTEPPAPGGHALCSSPQRVQIFAAEQPLSPETWAATRGGAAQGRGKARGCETSTRPRGKWPGEFRKLLPGSRATGKWGLDFRVCSHCWDVLIWFRSCFFRKFCFWSDWYLRAGRVTWIITPPLCPIQKQRISSSLRCLVCLSKRNKPLLVQLSHQGAHEAVIF